MVITSRCMGANKASRRFCCANGMPWASMALCSTSTRALKWPLVMSMSAWADFMSAPSYLQGPPLGWQAAQGECKGNEGFGVGHGKISSESDLGRQVVARLAAVVGDAGHDAAQVYISQRQ